MTKEPKTLKEFDWECYEQTFIIADIKKSAKEWLKVNKEDWLNEQDCMYCGGYLEWVECYSCINCGRINDEVDLWIHHFFNLGEE